MNRAFWKATLIRCIRTFLTTILGAWTVDTLVTEIDWQGILLAAFSTTVYIFIVCIVGGLPEVDKEMHLHQYYDEPVNSEVKDDEDE